MSYDAEVYFRKNDIQQLNFIEIGSYYLSS